MTKQQLIEFIQNIPVPDDSLVNVSINSEDIDTVESVGWSTPDEETTNVFCVDFILKTYPEIDTEAADEPACICGSRIFNDKGDCEKCGL